MVDKRFEKVASDPRFRQIKKDKNKVILDERFVKILDEKSEFGTNIVIDKYGRKLEKSGVEELQRYYRLNEKKDESNIDELKIDEQKFALSYNNARGEGTLESSSDEESENSHILLQDNDEDELELVTNEHVRVTFIISFILQKETVLLGDASSRFAVVNLDWDQIKVNLKLN